MEPDKAEAHGGKSISDLFDEALKTFEEIWNCDLATNSSEVQVCSSAMIRVQKL